MLLVDKAETSSSGLSPNFLAANADYSGGVSFFPGSYLFGRRQTREKFVTVNSCGV
jgi:hypothetical protein